MKRMLLQEVRQTLTGTDGVARSLQSTINGTKKKKTLSLPSNVHQHEEFRESSSMMVSSHDVILNQQEYLGRDQRTRKPTSKGLEYKISLSKERREKTYSRLARKFNAVEDLLYSSKNKVAVEEEILQINDLTKLLMSLHDEYYELLGEEDRAKSDQLLDMIDEQIFTFKKKIHRWLKCADEEQQRYAMSERVDLQKGHLVKAVTIAANQMLQESQAEAVSLETPRQEQWRGKQNLLNFQQKSHF